MFTVFHTADWHLGQSFFGFDRLYEGQQFLDWLFEELQEHRPQALLISGDVFDSINPSVAAQRLLYDFLQRTSSALPDLQVVITAGNHDSGARLEAPANLLQSLKISVVGTVQRQSDGTIDYERFLIPLVDAAGEPLAMVLAVPFLRPSDVPHLPDAEDPYLHGICALYRQVTDAALANGGDGKDAACPILAMGHCHVQGGAESRDSERRIVIGGAEALAADVFPDELSYVALGHLHKAQKFRNGTVRYSGSPIPLSFAEREYEHRVLKVEFQDGDLAVHDLSVPRFVDLIQIPRDGPASIDDVVSALQQLEVSETPLERQPFLEVRVLVDGPDPDRRRRIEEAIREKPVRLASIKLQAVDLSGDESDSSPMLTLSDLQSIDPQQVFVNAWREKYDGEPTLELLKAFQEVIAAEEPVA